MKGRENYTLQSLDHFQVDIELSLGFFTNDGTQTSLWWFVQLRLNAEKFCFVEVAIIGIF